MIIPWYADASDDQDSRIVVFLMQPRTPSQKISLPSRFASGTSNILAPRVILIHVEAFSRIKTEVPGSRSLIESNVFEFPSWLNLVA